MKKSHAGLWIGITALFLATVYSAVLFLVKPNLDISSWILYGFTMVAFLLMAIQSVALSHKAPGFIIDMALGTVSLIYFGVQFVLGGILFMFFRNLPMTPVLICEILLLAVYLGITFVVFAVQSHYNAQDRNDQHAWQKIKLWENEILCMADKQTDPAQKQALEALAEEFHFSDRTACTMLDDIETRIARDISILHEELADDAADVYGRIQSIRQLLNERNRTSEMLKR